VSLAVFEHINQVDSWVNSQQQLGLTVGFVPTMGALHAGHASLIELASHHCDRVVASIFVNPTQFNNADDLKKYPRTLEADLLILESAGCQAVFCPAIDEMYTPSEQTAHWDFGPLSNSLEGFYRPGHFDGVLTIVKKLFQAVHPNKAFFGEKDFQQLTLIERMVVEEKFPIDIIAAPTIRETSGLAMSSRNRRLSAEELPAANYISKALLEASCLGRSIAPGELQQRVYDHLVSAHGLKLEYCALVHARTFEPLSEWSGEKAVLLVAAFVGDTRLIDNVVIP
jgi:pantoate--beta-alanine ligase